MPFRPAAGSEMGISIRRAGKFVILDLDGPLELHRAAEELRRRVIDQLDVGARNVAVNLAESPYVDSAGMGALLAARSSMMSAGGKLLLLSPSRRVLDMLNRLRLEKIFEILEDEGELAAAA